MPIDVDRYLERIRVEGPVGVDLDSLARLQRAHMTWVAFENLDVFHRVGVTVDPISNVAKIVDRGRGGWCFEVNGAFAELLTSIGFHVRLLGAAVLLDGPNDVVDHLTLEVRLDDSFLVDVGFGESFWRPLRLNTDAVQDGGAGQFALFPSPKGTTLTSVAADGGLVPQYRFKRVSLTMADFEAASQRLQSAAGGHWVDKPFATRLIDGGPRRVTLLKDRLKLHDGTDVQTVPVSADEWSTELDRWFHMRTESF
ncbi:MAG: arylamine N-acetyltransferase [Acidimicrobiales bacterium]|nr:arylamine N-acetyltransferase [Acidimicrobiales bacterium]